MHFDFPAIMVTAVFFTGTVWALDAWLWAPKRRALAASQGGGPQSQGAAAVAGSEIRLLKEPLLVEYSRSLFPVILVVLLLRSFLVEPFRIPSGSMMPTLLVGDFILVNKFAYGLRLPVLDTKFIGIGEPKRGDVVVFRYPKDPDIDYIKRVIGLPGDRVAYYDKKLTINGEPMGQTELDTFVGVGSGVSMSGAKLRVEHLGDVQHDILIDPTRGTVEGEFRVPQGHYFVMGDNRDNSNDSRYWGFVPEENLVGKAFLIWMNWDGQGSGVAWSRIGSSIE